MNTARKVCETAERIKKGEEVVTPNPTAAAILAGLVATTVVFLTGGAAAAAAGAMGLEGFGAAVATTTITGTVGGATEAGLYSALTGNEANTVTEDAIKGGLLGGAIGAVTGGVGYRLNKFAFVIPANEQNIVSGMGGAEFHAPRIITNTRGELTNGKYILDTAGMVKHTNGTSGKSQFLFDVDADKAVLDAAAYADYFKLWKPNTGNLEDFANKAKVYVENGPVGVSGNGELTDYINVYRTKTNFVHGCPGNQ